LLEPERAAVPVAADRLEAGAPAAADAPDPPPAPLPEPPAEEVLAVELLCPAAPLVGVVVPGNVTAPYGLARLVPAVPPVVAVVCAAAGPASMSEKRNAV